LESSSADRIGGQVKTFCEKGTLLKPDEREAHLVQDFSEVRVARLATCNSAFQEDGRLLAGMSLSKDNGTISDWMNASRTSYHTVGKIHV
jgi:hypothetical protein